MNGINFDVNVSKKSRQYNDINANRFSFNFILLIFKKNHHDSHANEQSNVSSQHATKEQLMSIDHLVKFNSQKACMKKHIKNLQL